jgi:hypothetical protein
MRTAAYVGCALAFTLGIASAAVVRYPSAKSVPADEILSAPRHASGVQPMSAALLGRRRLTAQCASEARLSGQGTFTDGSPDDQPYDVLFECNWVITAALPGERVLVNFTRFDVEYEKNCDWDSVDVYDGVSPELGISTAGITGTNTRLKRYVSRHPGTAAACVVFWGDIFIF